MNILATSPIRGPILYQQRKSSSQTSELLTNVHWKCSHHSHSSLFHRRNLPTLTITWISSQQKHKTSIPFISFPCVHHFSRWRQHLSGNYDVHAKTMVSCEHVPYDHGNYQHLPLFTIIYIHLPSFTNKNNQPFFLMTTPWISSLDPSFPWPCREVCPRRWRRRWTKRKLLLKPREKRCHIPRELPLVKPLGKSHGVPMEHAMENAK